MNRESTRVQHNRARETWAASVALVLAVVCTDATAQSLSAPPPESPERTQSTKDGTISFSVRNAELAEVFEMLAAQRKVNILLANGVTGQVTASLHDVSTDFAIRNIADIAGFAVEKRDATYVVLKREDAGASTPNGHTIIRTLKVQYSKPEDVRNLLENYLSRYGKITVLKERSMLVVEDTPEFIRLVETVLSEVDRQPTQVLIEAKILEISLDESESFGINWTGIFGDGTAGVTGFAANASPGFFANIATDELDLFLNTLSSRGRVRTLSTPKLLAVENQESSVVIGDRIGYRVTTTINQVTTESVEFLESGVILRVTPNVDGQNRIVLEIHPEVSNGTVADGIPTQNTTEVTTRLVAADGQTVFIGGLMKSRENKTKSGVPILQHLPLIGGLFTKTSSINLNTETIVLITPSIIVPQSAPLYSNELKRVEGVEDDAAEHHERFSESLSREFDKSKSSTPGP